MLSLSMSLCAVIIICVLFCRGSLAKAYGKAGKYQMEQLLIGAPCSATLIIDYLIASHTSISYTRVPARIDQTTWC